MKKLKLSKDEKRLLRNIAAEVDYWPDGMSDEAVSCAASVLERHGLVRVAWASGHVAVNAMLTDYGKAYLLANPHLRGPIDWRWIIGTAISAATLAATLITMLTACRALSMME